jgi:hypothetical protein
MNKTLPLLIAGIVFGIVAILHALRIYYHLDVMVAGNAIPMNASYGGLIVSAILCIWMFISIK